MSRRRFAALLGGVSLAGAAAGFGIWWLALREAPEERSLTLYGPEGEVIVVGADSDAGAEHLALRPPTADECREAAAELSRLQRFWRDELERRFQLPQEEVERRLRALEGRDDPESAEARAGLRWVREYEALLRAWVQDEVMEKAQAWVDAGCPEDGIRGVLVDAETGERRGFVLLEWTTELDWALAHGRLTPALREWYAELGIPVPEEPPIPPWRR